MGITFYNLPQHLQDGLRAIYAKTRIRSERCKLIDALFSADPEAAAEKERFPDVNWHSWADSEEGMTTEQWHAHRYPRKSRNDRKRYRKECRA